MPSQPQRTRNWDLAIALTRFGLMADIAFFTQTIGVWLIQDDQPLVGSVHIFVGAATFFYLAAFGWATIQRLMQRERESNA